ncbi:MAG: type I glutamate--ammonia ligase [Kosmotogaceae bacterium]
MKENSMNVLKLAESENVKFIRLQITDINGFLKNVEIPVKMLNKALSKGILFDGSSIDGFVRIDESDMKLIPDSETAVLVPWMSKQEKTIRLICDVHLPDGNRFEGDPRYCLKKVIEKSHSMGFQAYAGPEPEFFLLPRSKENNLPIMNFMDKGSYFDLLPIDNGEETRKRIILHLEKIGFDVETAHHEVSPSQHEIDFEYTDILKTADNIQTFKWVVKTVALMNGLHATFMPKPFEGINGSGMHIHISLKRNGNNAFYDEKAPHQLSEEALYFIAGIIKYAPEFTAITNPTINSYKRLLPGFEAPTNISWALGNRSAMIRIPETRKEETRLEIRNPDPTCNPYLALASILGSGLKGIEDRIPPPAPVDGNIFEFDQQTKNKRKIKSLPKNLYDALLLLKKSDLIKNILEKHIFNKFLEMKEKEWLEYTKSVSEWEIENYLELY